MRTFKAFIATVVFSFAATAGQLALAETDSVPTMTVTGQGEIEVAPDMATVTLGVEVQESTAVDASRAASKRIAEVLIVLGRAGVATEDVQTTGLSLDPIYERARNDVDRPPRLLGFEARNVLTITMRDLDQVGKLLDEVIDEGANTFRGLRFGLQDPSVAEDAARREAVTDALAKAAVYADAAGITRGKILSLTEAGAGRPIYEAAPRMAMADAGVAIAPGSLTVKASVTMEFALEQ